MADKKEKPISVRLSTKAMARLDRLATELDMNRTSVIQEALKALEREQEARKASALQIEPDKERNGHRSEDIEAKQAIEK
jgi:predicted transcriptional regulator